MTHSYVYHHIDPRTGELVYVGRGVRARAWNVQSRSTEHKSWCEELMVNGYIPSDWVQVTDRNLLKAQACRIEKIMIEMERPIFNRTNADSIRKVTPEILLQAQELRTKGASYKSIAESFNLSTMTIHRALAGRTKSLEKFIAA